MCEHCHSEDDTRALHIDPALKDAGWVVVEGSRVQRNWRINPLWWHRPAILRCRAPQ
jgi:hypothetical protein